MKKYFIDLAALTVSLIALALSAYPFISKSVRINLIPTDVLMPAKELLQFGIAFQNFGDTEVLISEMEIREMTFDGSDDQACSKGRLSRVSTVRPLEGDWFTVKPGGFEVRAFRFNFSNPSIGRKNFCIQAEVHDIFGKQYSSLHSIFSATIQSVSDGRVVFTKTSFSEAPVNIVDQNYYFKGLL